MHAPLVDVVDPVDRSAATTPGPTFCRICLDGGHADLVSPCQCRGERWWKGAVWAVAGARGGARWRRWGRPTTPAHSPNDFLCLHSPLQAPSNTCTSPACASGKPWPANAKTMVRGLGGWNGGTGCRRLPTDALTLRPLVSSHQQNAPTAAPSAAPSSRCRRRAPAGPCAWAPLPAARRRPRWRLY